MKRLFKVADLLVLRKKIGEAVYPLSNLLAMVRAAGHIHQSNHWQTSGKEYYADHLLFERLYNDGVDIIDQLAERAVGRESFAHLGALEQCAKMLAIIRQVNEKVLGDEPDDMINKSLVIEEMVLEAVKDAKVKLSYSEDITDGTNALLDSVADLHETFIYLLRRRSKI